MIKTFSKKEESKLEEGNIKTIDNEQNVEDITLAVSTEVPEQVDKVEKDDKQAFEEFKIMYKGVIDIKCRQDFGDCEDEKLWEDTAKELFLQSKNYILVGDEYKAKEDLDDHLEKIEESKELKTELYYRETWEEDGIQLARCDFDMCDAGNVTIVKCDDNSDIYYVVELNHPEKEAGQFEVEYYNDESKAKEAAQLTIDLIRQYQNLDELSSIYDFNTGDIYRKIIDKVASKIKTDLEESKKIVTESRENDIETRVNQAKEWKQKVEDAVEATDLEEIVDEILEFAEDIKDNNFAGEDLYSGMSSVMDNGDAEARGPVTYVKSVKRDMQNILDDFIDNYEQAFEEESLEESVSNEDDVTSEFDFVKPFENNFHKIIIKKQGNEYFIFREDAKSDEDYIDHGNKDYIEGWLHGAIKANNKVITPLTESSDLEFNYQLLDRLKSDCEYFLGNGNRSEKHLWAGNCKEQIAKMREIYNSLDEKPEWLSKEDINNYEKEMCSKQLDEVEEVRPVNNYENIDKVWEDLLASKNIKELETKIEMIPDKFGTFGIEEHSDYVTITNYYEDSVMGSQEDKEDLYFENDKIEESKIFSENDIEKTIKKYLDKTNGIFTDDSVYDIVEELCGESDIDKMPKDLIDQVRAKVNKDNKIEEGYRVHWTYIDKKDNKQFASKGHFLSIDEAQAFVDELKKKPISQQGPIDEPEIKTESKTLEEKRTLPQAEIDQLRKNMRQVLKDHGKFKDDEELEDYIEEFMPMWIEAQENLGTPVTLDESKELKTEDQYEMERRKGRPNLNEIAKEVFEYDDYYVEVVDKYASEREFVIDHIAEVSAEYNLKEPAAWTVMEKIYKMAKDAKGNKVEESNVSDYTLNELNSVLQNAKEDGLGFTLQIANRDNENKTKHLNIDMEDFRAIYTALEGLKK